jgi:tripartite-type tricarboxylate transporter receptor subunit TctC
MDRRRLIKTFGASLLAAPLSVARAEDAFPTRPVRLVVPFAPGGSVDISARIVANYLQQELGQPVVVENRTGAGGRVGATTVASSPADGYTLLVGSSGSLTALEAIAKKLSFQLERDFVPIAQLNITPMVVEVGRGSEANTFAELIAAAKAKPSTIGIASAGIGSSNHLAIELLQSVTGATFLHVPYKGSGQAVADLLAGHVPAMVDQIASSISYIREKQFRALAVMSPTRSLLLPDVPSMKDLGFDGVQAASFTGILAPTGTPPKALEKLERAIIKVASLPDVAKRFGELGADPQVIGSVEFGKFLKTDLARWKAVAQKANISIE